MIRRIATSSLIFLTTGLLTLSNYCSDNPACLSVATGVESGRLLRFLHMTPADDNENKVWTTAKWLREWTRSKCHDTLQSILRANYMDALMRLRDSLRNTSLFIDDYRRAVPHNEIILTALATAAIIGLARKGIQRYKTAPEIPPRFLKKGKRLTGYCVTVNDSDNLRFYHQRLLSFGHPNLSRQGMWHYICGTKVKQIGRMKR